MPNAIYDDQDSKTPEKVEPIEHDKFSDADEAKAHELSDLENQFDAPAIKDEDRNTTAKDKNAEAAPNNSQDLFKPSQTSPMGGGKFSNLVGTIKRNPKKAGLGGLGLAGILTFIVFIIVGVGPLQFIHLSQMMQEIHFSDSETTSNNRIRKLIQYIHTKDATKTRLGVVGNKIVDRVDKKLKANGWTITHDAAGNYKGMVYDPSKAEPPLSNKEAKRQVKQLEQDLKGKGIKVTASGTTLKIEPGKGIFSSFYDKKVISTIHRNNTEHGKILSAIQKRNLNKRSGIHFNPITKLDNKIKGTVAEKVKKWQEERKASKALKGASAVGVVPADGDPEDPNKPKPITDNANETGKLTNDASSGKLTAGKIAGAGAAGIGFLCIARSIANGADESRLMASKIALMKQAAEYIAIGNKAMAGDDIDMEVLDELNTELNGVAGGSGASGSWTSANSLQPYQNSTNAGTKLPDELNPNPSQGEIAKILNQFGFINTACEALESAPGQIIGFAVGLATGPISTVVTAIAMPAVMNSLQSFFSTDPIDMTKYSGAVMGEAVNVGSAMLSNESNSVMGGWAVSDTQVAELQNQYQQIKKVDDSTRSIADRYINPYKYDTVTGKLIDQTDSNKIASSLASTPTKLLSSITAIFNPNAKAASVKYSEVFYGMNKISFPVEALDSVEDPYKNASEVQNILKGSRSGELISRLELCNKIKVDPATLTFSYDPDSTIPSFERLNERSPECKSMNDADFNKLRIAALDTTLLNAYACYEFNEEDSCTDMVNDTSTSQQVGESQEGSPINTRFGPFIFPVGASQAEIKKGGWCWDKQDTTCHGTEDYSYYASDIMIKEGVPILSATNGKVVKVEQEASNKDGSAKESIITIKANDCDDSGTKLTCIGEGTVFWYSHMKPNSALVKVGDTVKAGQQIAVSGGAPQGDGTAHLHFDATDRKNKFRMSCSRDSVELCKAVGFINIQPELYKAFQNIGKDGDTFSNTWVWPLAKDLKAGNCWDSYVSGLGYHAGMDINTDNVSENNPAVAAHDGVVVTASKSGGAAGNYITIKTDDGIYFSYEHLTSFKVKVNDRVTANQPIGIVGKTGRVSASSAGHLHFVVAKSNTIGAYSSSHQKTTVDPMDYLPKNAPSGYKCLK